MNDDEEPDGRVIVDLMALLPGNARSPIKLAEHFTIRLLGRTLSPEDTRIIAEVGADGNPLDDDLPEEHWQYFLPGMVETILMHPAFQVR